MLRPLCSQLRVQSQPQCSIGTPLYHIIWFTMMGLSLTPLGLNRAAADFGIM